VAKKGAASRRKKKTLDSVLPSHSTRAEEVGQEGINSRNVASTRQSKQARKSSTKRNVVETESWVDRYLDELVEAFNLDMLGLSPEESRYIVVRLVDILRGESSSLNKESIKRRFNRYIQQMNQLIAQHILELREELTVNQLEFVVNNIGEAILGYAPRLYKEVMRLGRADLLDVLRNVWRTYWVQRKYHLLPVTCPRCGFDSLMPDLVCIVCGAVVDEKELKQFVEFEKLLEDFVKQYSEEDVQKTLVYGYLYLNSLGLKPPTHERDKLDLEILLTSKEKDLLKTLLEKKRGE